MYLDGSSETTRTSTHSFFARQEMQMSRIMRYQENLRTVLFNQLERKSLFDPGSG
jgi:hypothetical protein